MKLTRNEQKELFIELGKSIEKAGKAYAQMLNLENVEEKYKEILKVEDLGDDMQAKLDAHFSTQKNAPYLTLERAKLLRRIDDALDNFAIAARTMNVFAESLPEDFVSRITVIAELVQSASEYFYEAVENLFSNFTQALKITGKIEEIRDKVIDVSFRLETEYFQSLSGGDSWKKFTAVERVMKRTAACIQKIKDGTEIIELMVYKYSAE